MVKYQQTEFEGVKALSVSNGIAELIIPTDMGIRIMSYSLKGGSNIFKVYSEHFAALSQPGWQLYGGHRVWHSPESKPRCYEEENLPLEQCQQTAEGLLLTQVTDDAAKVQKQMLISLAPDSAEVTVKHSITNRGEWPIKLSVWALSVLKSGGICAIEVPEKFMQLLPDRAITLWPYARLNDKRVYWGDRVIALLQDSAASEPFKYGTLAAKGKAVYLNDGVLFTKAFEADEFAKYPDRGCNFEAYTNAEMLECESLSPLTVLDSGQTATHTEKWNLQRYLHNVDLHDEVSILKLFK